MYIITIRNRKHRFSTVEAASRAAADIFTRTGVVVGIEQETGK